MGRLKASINGTLGLRGLVADHSDSFASCEQQEAPDLRGNPRAYCPHTLRHRRQLRGEGMRREYESEYRRIRKMCLGLVVVPSRPNL